MKGINRLRYASELNVFYDDRRRREFFLEHGVRAGEALKLLLRGIHCDDGSANLSWFLLDNGGVEKIGLIEILEFPPREVIVCAFPDSGQISYLLNSEEAFFSNAHQNPDPLVVQDIERGIHLHPTRTEDYLLEYRRPCPSIPNRVNGLVLFRRNVREYGFLREKS